MKAKLNRLVSMLLCVVMLIGIVPFSALAASAYTLYIDDTKVSGDTDYYIDLDDGTIYEDDEDGDEITTISVSSTSITLSKITKLFECADEDDYVPVVEYYTSSSYSSSKIYTSSTIKTTSYDEIYVLVYVVPTDDYEDYKDDAYDDGFDYFYEFEDEYDVSYKIYELSFYWDESDDDDDDFSMDVELDEEFELDPDDFFGSSSWDEYYYIVFGTPKYGDIFDEDGDEIDYGDDEIYLEDLDDYYYYCDDEDAEDKGYDYVKFTIYDDYYGKKSSSGTFYFYYDSSSSSSDESYTMVVKADDENYFSDEIFEYFEDEEDFDLSDYSSSKVYFKVESLPTSGYLYDDDGKMSKGDLVKLSNIDEVYYYKSSSTSSTITMTFSLIYYKSGTSGTGTYLIKKGTIEFTFGADEITSFSKEFVTGTGVSFTASDFTSNFTAAKSSGSLTYIKITSLPSYGTLYLSYTAVSKGDTIAASKLGQLTYIPNSSSITYDSFTWSATSGSSYSSTATVLLTGSYTPSGYSISVSGSLISLTFDTATASGTQVTQSLSADDVTYILSQVSSSGSTLVVYMPLTSTSSYSGRSLTIDDSLFTSTNVAKISRVILVDTTTSGYNLYLSIPTASILSLYNSSSYTGDFTMALSAASLTDEDKAAAATSVGMARDVDMQIGVINVSPAGAELSIPYNTSNDQNTAVIMVRTGYQSYEPVLSSTWSDYMPYVTSDTNPYVTCEVEANKVYLSTVNSQSFSDLASTHWGYDYIRYLSARGVMSGYTGTYEGMVMPDTSVSRAEFIKMLVVALDLYDASATTTYTDVTGNASWAESYIGSAQKAGILTDTGDTFNPTEAITREDMALYAYRAAEAADITLTATTSAITFNDADEFSSTEIATAISAMQQAGIISGEAVNGEATGDFDPSGVTTRAAAAKIISMLMELAY